MQKPDLIKFVPGTKAKATEVNQNFEELANYVFGSAQELKAYVQTAVANMNLQLSQSVFTGKIEMFGGDVDNIPLGWLLCDGSEVDREEQSKLFNAIGTKYGAGNGVTTFNVPNLIGRFVEGGTEAGIVKEAAIPNVTGWFGGDDRMNNHTGLGGAFYMGEWANSGNSGAEGGFVMRFDASRCSSVYKDNCKTVQPPSVTTLFIIKT